MAKASSLTYRKAMDKLRKSQMTHTTSSDNEQARKEGWSDVRSALLPQSPAEAAAMLMLGPVGGKLMKGGLAATAALASDDAEAAFIGPKGIERLRKLGHDVKTWPSRFFGERAEINPSDTANVWWRMGAPSMKLDDMIKSGKTSVLFKDILPEQEFPELAAAYPEIFRTPVKIRPSQWQEEIAASYAPLKTSDIKNKYKARSKVQERLEREYEKTHPEPKRPDPRDPKFRVPTPDGKSSMLDFATYNAEKAQHSADWDKWRNQSLRYPYEKFGIKTHDPVDNVWFANREEDEALKDAITRLRFERRRQRSPGIMTLNVPEQGVGDNPSLGFVESLLHEAGHEIQDVERPPGITSFLSRYTQPGEDLAKTLVNRAKEKYNKTGLLPEGQGLKWEEEFEPDEMKFRNWLDTLGYKERKLVQPFLDDLWWPPTRNQLENLTDKLYYTENGGSQLVDSMPDFYNVDPIVKDLYRYKMNPYEREVFESSKRDIDPQYRKMYSRKTEELNPTPPIQSMEELISRIRSRLGSLED